MQNKPKKNSNKASKLVEAIKLINHKIEYLIDCSGEDFITLNNNFVQYHKDIEKQTSNLDSVLDLFAEKIKILSPLVITDITLNLQNTVKTMDKKVAALLSISKEIEKNLNYTLLPINNAKQDISTLRLINTNMKFDSSLKKVYMQLNDTLLNLLNCFENVENKIVALKNSVDVHSITLERKAKKLLTTIQSNIHYYNELYEFLMTKRSDAEEYKPLVDELKSKKTASSSQIITNLQYQDIIRQKIEHVKHAQSKVLQNLSINKKEVKSNVKEEMHNYRHLLHDIGTLQVAQLVHANQKYQNAIDTIIEKFKELDKNLNKINEISRDIKRMDDFSSKAIFEQQLITNRSKIHFKDFEKLIHTFFINVENAYSQSKLLTEEYNKLNCIKAALEILSDNIQAISNNKTTHQNTQNSLKQFADTLTEVYANTKRIEELLLINHKNIKKISTKKNKDEILDACKKSTQSFYQLSEYFSRFINENEEVFKMLGDDEGEYHSASEVNFSIENVKYYKMFETEIENIIHHINLLTTELNIENTGNKGKKGDLDFLKKLYSMRSERIVHDRVTGENKNADEESESEDEGSLELF